MTIKDWLKGASARLKQSGIGTARLDCLVLLEDVLNTNRTQLLASDEQILSHEQISHLNRLIARRSRHEPLAYIRGKTEFYGRQFAINKHVLEPRPETETMLDLLLNLPSPKQIIDVGTGSGAIAITTKLELPTVSVWATDIDQNCLKLARQNAATHSCQVKFIKTDLLQDIVVTNRTTVLANLPYVPDDYQLNQAAYNEPRLAIFGGADGLDLYRRMFDQLAGRAGAVLTESLPFQHKALAKLAATKGYKLTKTADFIQVYLPGT